MLLSSQVCIENTTAAYIKTRHQLTHARRVIVNVDKIIVGKCVQHAFHRQLSNVVTKSGHRSGIVQQNHNILGACGRFNVPGSFPAVIHIDGARTFPDFG